MQYLSLLAIVGATNAQVVSKGLNYGNSFTDGSCKQQADFEAEFIRAQDLPNTSGFSSARSYTMIQGGTANTPISAIQAAIDTDTSLLLGLWVLAGNKIFQNELIALSSAIVQYAVPSLTLLSVSPLALGIVTVLPCRGSRTTVDVVRARKSSSIISSVRALQLPELLLPLPLLATSTLGTTGSTAVTVLFSTLLIGLASMVSRALELIPIAIVDDR